MARTGKGGLGKGLDALFADNTTQQLDSPAQFVRVSQLEPNKEQPRKSFDDDALSQLADSIKAYGVIQPILVTETSAGTYRIVAGERRWRAARMAGLDKVPVVIRQLSDAQVMQIALIENLQRENLNPMEEAAGYQKLIEGFSMTQEEVARTVGKSRSAVANALRLLALPEDIRQLVEEQELSAGHARAILSIRDDVLRLQTARKAAAGELTVRDIERIGQKEEQSGQQTSSQDGAFPKNPYCAQLALALQEAISRKVAVKPSGGKKSGKGVITLEYYDEDDLKRICTLLSALGQETE